MSLDQAMKNLKFDTRMLEIQLSRGTLTQPELQKHLDTLPDLANLSEPLMLATPTAREDGAEGSRH